MEFLKMNINEDILILLIYIIIIVERIVFIILDLIVS